METDATLFPSLLGAAWPDIAAPVQRVHGGTTSLRLFGTADVDGSTALAARCLRRLLELPGPGPGQSVNVEIDRSHGHAIEVWTRRFASGRMRSTLRTGPLPLLEERLGPVTLRFHLQVEQGEIVWTLVGARMLGLPIPRALLGRVSARSGARGDSYHFAVAAELPLIGRWIAYQGTLEHP
jgi:hypothetical protein